MHMYRLYIYGNINRIPYRQAHFWHRVPKIILELAEETLKHFGFGGCQWRGASGQVGIDPHQSNVKPGLLNHSLLTRGVFPQ